MKHNFDFNLNITKTDIITIVLLSLIFFSVAITNLGATQVPSNSVTITPNPTSTPQAAIITLENATFVNKIYFYIKCCQNNNDTMTIYTGQPDSWYERDTLVTDFPYVYMSWRTLTVYQTTQYIRLEFASSTSIELNEIAILDQDNQMVPIASIISEDDNGKDYTFLIDEQDIVTLPNTYMTETMFDEVYFTKTAQQYLNRQWPYEWTHPPLGKIIISAGIAVFGLNPFGWRIMGVLFGTLMIPVIFLLGKKMFDSYIGGFSAAFLFTFDFLHFSEARLGITDTYVVFFSLLSHLFFFIYLSGVVKKGLKNTSVVSLFLSFVFFSLGFATKWLVLFGFLGGLMMLVALRFSEVVRSKGDFSNKLYTLFDHPYAYVVAFVFVSLCLYFVTYVPDMLAGRTLMNVFEVQGAMYSYHAGPIGLDHPYSSPGWSWPIIGRPVWLYVSNLPGDLRSSVSLFGNPAVWWVGFAAIVALTGFAVYRVVVGLKSRRVPVFEVPVAFLSVVFFAQWLPYAFVSRGLFLYHYYVNVPIICLGSAYFISKYWHNRWMKVVAIIYFILVVALFVLFYPVISGMPVLSSVTESLRWFEQWVF